MAISVAALAGADTLINLILGLADRISQASALFAKARAEGREPTSAELQALDDEYTNTIRPALLDAIAQAKARGD